MGKYNDYIDTELLSFPLRNGVPLPAGVRERLEASDVLYKIGSGTFYTTEDWYRSGVVRHQASQDVFIIKEKSVTNGTMSGHIVLAMEDMYGNTWVGTLGVISDYDNPYRLVQEPWRKHTPDNPAVFAAVRIERIHDGSQMSAVADYTGYLKRTIEKKDK